MSNHGLKVLMISSDRSILSSGSIVSERMQEYGSLVTELHIVLMSDAGHNLKNQQLSKNVWVYPTNSTINILRPIDAARIGKKIVFDSKFVRGESLITAQDIESSWAASKIKRKWRLPLEIQFHTDPFSPYFRGFQNVVRKMFLRKVLGHADSVRVVSANLKDRIAEYTQADINVLPIYIDRQHIENAKASFDLHERFGWQFILLSVSRLAPEKNLPLTLEALSMVCSKFPDTGLVVVGSGPEEGRLKALADKLNLEKNVAFVGWQDDLASFYKTANAFVQTSRYEGYGMSLVEAGLSGLPIVTTSVGIARDLENGRDAYVFEDNQPELFAHGIMDLIEHNHKRELFKVNIKHTLENKLLNKDDYMAKIKAIWEDAARKVK